MCAVLQITLLFYEKGQLNYDSDSLFYCEKRIRVSALRICYFNFRIKGFTVKTLYKLKPHMRSADTQNILTSEKKPNVLGNAAL